MKRIYILFAMILAASSICKGQMPVERIRQLKDQLAKTDNDSLMMVYTEQIAIGYRFSNMDSSVHYNDKSLRLSEDRGDKSKRSALLSLKGATLLEAGLLAEALQNQLEALRVAEEINEDVPRALALNHIGNIYMEMADYRKANEYYFQSRDLFKKADDLIYYNELSNIGNIYTLLGMPDSALHYYQIVMEKCGQSDDRHALVRPEIMYRMGKANQLKKDNVKAMEFCKLGIAEALFDHDLRDLTMCYIFMADLFREINQIDSSFRYGFLALGSAKEALFRKGKYEASLLLSELFHTKNNADSAYKYLLLASVEKEALMGTEKIRKLERILLDEKEAQRKSELKRIADQSRQRQLLLLTGLFVFLVIAFILYRNNRQKQTANKALEQTLTDLKLTQGQLIQSEKMASLGELTAGIAHEIQNPLNFVNNFSEVNTELIEEMNAEIEKGNLDEVKALAGDIRDNQEKITQHGKRADGIVKGMLQHSRSSSGVKEPTDINALTDEYLRLAYHGLRAKDKSFNATMHTDFDPAVVMANVVPQDIGRVILNLITNAFYAVNEKKKTVPNGYEPAVSVSTKKTNEEILITVQDNGEGISDSVREKIFQPFFTTKPTGQGTGLGLSMSYDILKAHGGELRAESKVGEGALFIISLPAN